MLLSCGACACQHRHLARAGLASTLGVFTAEHRRILPPVGSARDQVGIVYDKACIENYYAKQKVKGKVMCPQSGARLKPMTRCAVAALEM